MPSKQEKVNEIARNQLSDERKKLGFDSVLGEDDEEDLDRGNLEDDEDSDDEDEDDKEEDSDDDSDEDDEQDESDSDDEDEDDSDEDDSEDKDEDDEDFEDEKSKVNPKRAKVFEKVKSQKREIKQLQEKIADLETKLPDDFDDELAKFTKEIGVEDPESLAKIVGFLKKFAVDKNGSKLQKQIDDLKTELAQEKQSKPIDDSFPDEWGDFKENVFKKDFPHATKDERIAFKKQLEILAKSKGTGGKVYTDPKSGKEVLDPYPLDYIYFKNKDKLAKLVTSKKVKSMESARTAGITTKERQDETDLKKPLPKNASGDAISKIDKKYRDIENKGSGLRDDGDNSI